MLTTEVVKKRTGFTFEQAIHALQRLINRNRRKAPRNRGGGKIGPWLFIYRCSANTRFVGDSVRIHLLRSHKYLAREIKRNQRMKNPLFWGMGKHILPETNTYSDGWNWSPYE